MENSSLCDSLLKWLETFPGRQGTRMSDLTDGVLMANVLHQIAPEYFTDYWLTRIKTDVGDNWRLKVSNLRKVQQGVVDYYQEQLNQNIRHFPLPDLNKIGEHGDEVEIGRLLQLLLGCAVNCENKQQYIEAIMNMEERVQKVIMEAIQELMLREGSPGAFGPDGEGRVEGLGLSGIGGPASFHPHLKSILEQLEAATQGKEEAIQTCHELEQQISVLKEEKGALAGENERLVGRLEAWEAGADLGAGSSSTLRYKDLRKQIEGLQDELFKLETSRDEYRSRTEVLERENQEVQAKNEELQELADQARSLKDEVDVLREMSERVVVYEGTVETYKKKLEELSDLKRQMRILEEKNSDYMQHNMELEEELKKSGTWRPQLDMYKKQVAELHQKLAEEAKKTDRQIFENKKLAEKMEALVQERDRLAKERDGLKETIEELKCHISTITSPDTASRPPSDLSDVELLDAVPHEFRERLMRLQYENSVLKKAAEGGSSDQLPMLQTLVADLQERQASLTQENRWGSGGDLEEAGGLFSLYGKRRSGGSLSPPLLPGSFTLPEAHFSSDRKLRVIRRNLKWASESDLLILRQPKGLYFHPSSPSSPPPLLPFSQPSSLPPLPSTSTSATLATQTSKEAPIVIRHIHEFKIPPSPTNEDSGCCRTSPSSCEEEGQSRDFVGTLDSGISGMFPGTLESGVSGVYRCLSPVIPPIVEECTAHHLTDLLPHALLGGPTTILHHSHPAHTSTCLHCCSPSPRNTGRAISPTQPPPRPHSVCSYNPPHYKNITTSPTPSSMQPNPSNQSSPPLSPLTHAITPSTQTHTQSSPLPKLSLDVNTEQSSSPPPPPPPATTTSPTGRRGGGGGYTRTPIPPESPTPHNSPRLPNSINATRCRSGGGKLSSPTLGLHEGLKDLKDLKDVPSTTSFIQGHTGTPDKTTKPQETFIITPQLHNTEEKTQNVPLNRGTVGLERGNSTRTSIRRRSESEDSRRRSGSESSPTTSSRKAAGDSQRSGLPSRSPSQPPESRLPRKKDIESVVVSCLPPPSLQAVRRSEGRLERNSPAYSSMKPVRYEGSRALERNTPLRASISSQPNREKGKVRETNSAIPSSSIHLVRVERNTPPSTSVCITTTASMTPAITAITTQPLRNGDTNIPTNTTRITQAAPSPVPHPMNNTSIAPITPLAPVTLARQPSDKARQSPRGSLRLGDKQSTLQGKQANHVKFREPVVSQVTHSDPAQTSAPQYSPASPRERMSPPNVPAPRPDAAPGRKGRATDPGGDKGDRGGQDKNKVTLLSDTLFTHFEVAGPPHTQAPTHARRVRPVAPSDTDTDLETLERRLTLGMYAAPLVSSESCTSFSHDDYTASDDPECYNPMQFKAYGDSRRRRRVNGGPRRSLTPPPTPPKQEPLPESALGRTYSFFRRQPKAKKQLKAPEKEVFVPPLGQAGRVVKARNKTAKVVVAETLNAVFTLCTP